MKFGIKEFLKPTPAKVRKWRKALAAISAGIGTLGYLAAMPLYIHIGGVCFILSVLIPTFFGESDEQVIDVCNCGDGCICDKCHRRDEVEQT
jgi:hypothetical protein